MVLVWQNYFTGALKDSSFYKKNRRRYSCLSAYLHLSLTQIEGAHLKCDLHGRRAIIGHTRRAIWLLLPPFCTVLLSRSLPQQRSSLPTGQAETRGSNVQMSLNRTPSLFCTEGSVYLGVKSPNSSWFWMIHHTDSVFSP